MLNLHHAFEDADRVVLVLEAADPLNRYVDAAVAPIGEVALRKYLVHVLEALRYLHEQSYTHGAVWLENVYLKKYENTSGGGGGSSSTSTSSAAAFGINNQTIMLGDFSDAMKHEFKAGFLQVSTDNSLSLMYFEVLP